MNVPATPPPSADATANTPAPQPWQQRQRLFAESAVALQDTSLENPLRQRLFIQTNYLNSEYAPEIDDIAGHDNWLDRIAKRDVRLGKKTEGIELTVGDVEDVAASVAEQLLQLRQNQNIDSFFRQRPEEATYLFKLLFSRTIVAKNAANNAGLFVDGVARSMLIGLDSRYLQPQDHLEIADDPLAFEALKPDQKAAMPYALVAIQSLDSLIEDRMVSGSNSLANITENSKDHIVASIKKEKGFNSAGLTGLPSDAIELPKRIGSNQQIMLDVVDDPLFASTTANSRASELAPGTQTPAEAGQATETDRPIIAKLSDRFIEIEGVRRLEAGKLATEIETLQQRLEVARNDERLAGEKASEALALEDLQAARLLLDNAWKGVQDDERPSNELLSQVLRLEPAQEGDPSIFFKELARIDPSQLAEYYGVDTEALSVELASIRSLNQASVPFDMLSQAYMLKLDEITQMPAPDRLNQGRQSLAAAQESPDEINRREQELKDVLQELTRE